MALWTRAIVIHLLRAVISKWLEKDLVPKCLL